METISVEAVQQLLGRLVWENLVLKLQLEQALKEREAEKKPDHPYSWNPPPEPGE